jgi:hypothetical protein
VAESSLSWGAANEKLRLEQTLPLIPRSQYFGKKYKNKLIDCEAGCLIGGEHVPSR